MDVVAKLDDWGKPAWITVMIFGFVLFWPLGLAVLAYMIWSGRMGCRSENWDSRNREDWRAMREEWRDRKRAFKKQMRERWHTHHEGRRAGPFSQSSGNAAFDDYKAETIRRLEDEQAEFHEFLESLRKSKDKAEFDQFMASRRAARETAARDVTPDDGDRPVDEGAPRPAY